MFYVKNLTLIKKSFICAWIHPPLMSEFIDAAHIAYRHSILIIIAIYDTQARCVINKVAFIYESRKENTS